MNKAIALSNISFQYKRADRPALDRISWSLNPGECAVIMGPSASGKTTLCRSLNGLIPQALEGRLTGDIRVAGKNVKRFRVQTMAKDIGFVMQDPETQIVGRTVFEDLAFGPKNFLVPALEIKKRIPKALSYMGLEGYENRSTAELSGGEKQRIAIAGILAMEPSILVLDDPASELDPKGRANLYAHLNRLKHSRGLTLVIVEQKIEDLMFIADQAVVMKKGKIVFQGSPEQVPRPIIPELFNSRTNESKTMDSPLLLTVRDLNFGFTQAAPVLKHINLELRQKDFIALMGHNGAGKTTLVKHLNGLICAHPGTIQFCGKDLSTMTIKERARFVGFVFQNPDHQIFETSVEKEIAFGLAGQGLSKEKITQRVDQTLAETGLEPFRQRHPFTLGKGMRQVIAVASIVALNPQVLVVDEPTTGLDPEGSRHIMDLIARLHDQGTAIVLITHDLSLAAGYARRLVVMNQGKIILDREMSADLHTHPALQAAGLIPSKKKSSAMDRTDTPPPQEFPGLDIRSKLALFFTFLVWTLIFTHPGVHAIMGVMILGTGIITGLTIRQMLSRIIPLAPLLAMIILFTAFTGSAGFIQPENIIPLFTLGNTLCLTRGGLLLGTTFLLRLINMVVFTHILLASTPLDEFITLFVKLRLSPAISFLITTALRFIPALDKKRDLIIAAQQARGIDITSGNWFRQFKGRMAVMIPLIVNAIVIADQLSMALMNRGFGYKNNWTQMTGLEFHKRDYVIIFISILGVALAVAVRYQGNWGNI